MNLYQIMMFLQRKREEEQRAKMAQQIGQNKEWQPQMNDANGRGFLEWLFNNQSPNFKQKSNYGMDPVFGPIPNPTPGEYEKLPYKGLL